jgi:hypothetical protein
LRKRVAYPLALLFVLLVLTATTSSAVAADYTKIGVKIGDKATYALSETGSTDNTTTMLVWGILGTQVYLNFTDYTPSGTVDVKYPAIVADVYAGGGSGSVGYMRLIASNLTANDELYLGSAGYWINDTTSMIISGINRTVNHFKILGGDVEVWWDKATGLMVKLNFWRHITGWYNLTMISTTAWSAPAQPPSLFGNSWVLVAIGEGVLIVALIALVALRRGGKKR